MPGRYYKVKKIIALLMCVFSFVLLLCACGDKKDAGDLSYIISLSAQSPDYSWSCETTPEGIVSVSEETASQNDGSVNYTYILESVGEGETKSVFTCTDSNGKTVRTIEYKITVDSNYKITAVLVSDEEPTESVIEVNTKTEAENLIRQVLTDNEPENEGKLIFETVKNDDGTFSVRVFKMTTGKNGKQKYKYSETYIIGSDGSMKLVSEKDVPDKKVTLK